MLACKINATTSDAILFSAARARGTMSAESTEDSVSFLFLESMEENASLDESTEESVSLESSEESTEENVSSDGSTDGSDIRSALDLCRLVEANRPKIEMLDIGFMSIDRAVWAGFEVPHMVISPIRCGYACW